MKICIIGGKGRMGRAFEKIFLEANRKVKTVGRTNKKTLQKIVNESDAIIISVPLSASKEAIDVLSKVIGKEKVLIDFSSVMSDNILEMKKQKCQYAVDLNFNLSVSSHIDEFKKRRDYIYSKLKPHFEITKPDGAFYFFVSLDEISGEKFSKLCLKRGLLVVPGKVCSKKDNHFRIAYAVNDEKIRKGCEILIDIAKSVNANNRS